MSVASSVAVHPLRLLTCTDSSIQSLYHAFFFVELQQENSVTVMHRIPQSGPHMEDTESGVKFFISEIAVRPFEEESFGNFVLTSSDGSRLNAFWRGLGRQVLIATAQLFLASFTRDLFESLRAVPASHMYRTLLSLCNAPILPISCLTYRIRHPNFSISLSFSRLQIVDDIDINAVATSILTPRMLVNAWEAILLERKVLVASSNSAVVTPCCEFLRRLVLPLDVINTYVPFLTYQLINALDSPLPFLVGADTATVRDSHIDLSETVVVDLDARAVHTPKYQYGKIEVGAPSSVVANLFQKLSEIYMNPLQSWLNRTTRSNENDGSPLSSGYVHEMADQIVELFASTNVALLTARASSSDSGSTVPSFFRRIPAPVSTSPDRHAANRPGTLSVDSVDSGGGSGFTMGFNNFNEVASGTIQLLRERFANDNTVYFLPCWVEMDNVLFSVYEQADETPILCLYNKDLRTVSPAALEPEGHVFEVIDNQQKAYRFAATDSDSRRLWMAFIEEKLKQSVQQEVALSSASPIKRDARDVSSPLHVSSPTLSVFDEQHPLTPLFGREVVVRNPSEEEQVVSEFRHQLKKTQMFSFMNSKIECFLFDTALKKAGMNIDSVADRSLELPLNTLLWEGNSVSSVVDRVCSKPMKSSLESMPNVTVPPHELVLDPPESVGEDLNSTFGPIVRSKDDHAQSSSSKRPSTLTRVQSLPVGSSSRQSFLGGLFKGLYRKNTEDAGAGGEAMEREQAEREYLENKKLILQRRLQHVVSSNRRAEEELHRCVVEGKMNLVSKILKHLSSRPKRDSFEFEIPIGDVKLASEPTTPLSDDSELDWFGHMWSSIPSGPLSKADSDEIESVEDDGYEDSRPEPYSPELAFVSEEALIQDIHSTFLSKFETSSQLASDPIILEVVNQLRNAMIGHFKLKLGLFEEAALCFINCSVIDQGSLMDCVCGKFKEVIRDDVSFVDSMQSVLVWSAQLSRVVGLQAYRLLTELVHRTLSKKLSKLCQIELNQLAMDRSYSLGLQRGFGIRPNFTSLQREDIMSKVLDRKRVKDSGAAVSNPRVSTKNEAFNELVLDSSLVSSAGPCELSISLLTRLRELLKSSFEKNSAYRSRDGYLRIRVGPGIFDEIISSSAFRAFEMETCLLQNADINGLSTEERIVFFCNIYNAIAVHASILHCHKGGIGSNLMERTAFMRTAKYNIGGTTFSMFDIEYGILRAESASPMIFGPFSPSMSFSDRDPRKVFALPVSKPLVTFFLFTAIGSSPVLSVLRDPNTVDGDLKRSAKLYIQQHVKLDVEQNIVELPELFRVYWRDFGGCRANVLTMIRRFHTRAFSDAVKKSKPKIVFSNTDWVAILTL